MRSKRIKEIKNYIYGNKTVTLDQIFENFNISKSTIRRDLDEILENSNIKKIYGEVTAGQRKSAIFFHGISKSKAVIEYVLTIFMLCFMII